MGIRTSFSPMGAVIGERKYIQPVKTGYGMHEHSNNPSFGVLVTDVSSTYYNRPGWQAFGVLPLDFPMQYNDSYRSGGKVWTQWYDTTTLQRNSTGSMDLQFEKPIKITSLEYYVGVGSWGWFNYTLEVYGSNDGTYSDQPIGVYVSSYPTSSPTVKLFPTQLVIGNPEYFSNYRLKMITPGGGSACGLVELKLNAVYK